MAFTRNICRFGKNLVNILIHLLVFIFQCTKLLGMLFFSYVHIITILFELA